MKIKTILLAASLILSSIVYGQAKNKIPDTYKGSDTIRQRHYLFIQVDSQDVVKFLNIFSTGVENLMNSNVPVKDFNATNQYGRIFLSKQVDEYNSWFHKPDTTSKKPIKP